ncbi:MAG: hypothetical protein LBQ78_00855 [Tannerellaceae bacterium]|jgi:hypothetical protein|nr:hypothetical protein [Tannerellaceae bacterium]
MKKMIITILAVLLFANKVDAQLFKKQELYPGIRIVKEKSYNDSGGGGYWSIAKLDHLGRIIEEEYYRKKELRGRHKSIYNSNNDKLYDIVTYDINNPNRIDTISNYEYKYQGNSIIYQKNTSGNHRDSTVIQLIENKGDTILIYQHKSYYFRPKTNTTDIYEKIHTLKYQNGLLVYSEKFNPNENYKEMTFFEYYPNGRLKRRKIEREPEPEFSGMYVGSPGSDDESYEYKFDKSGRIKAFYCIIEKKKYKITTYKYFK